MALLLKGAPVAEALQARTTEEVARLREQGVKPCLAILRVGYGEEGLAYERGATKRCTACGIDVRPVILPADCVQDEVLAAIRALNEDASVHGILMMRPLPAGIDEAACCEALSPDKDVDGAGSASAARVFTGTGRGFAPCTPQACMELCSYYDIGLSGKRVVLLGRSLVVGRPLSMMMLAADASVTVCHSKSGDISAFTREADIVVSAMGRLGSVGKGQVRAGQTIIDVATNCNPETGRLCGDVRFDEVEPLVDALTPVPGGIGAITTAVLACHVAEAARS